MTWTDQAAIESSWSSSPTQSYTPYDFADTYDGLTLSSSDIDLRYDGGYKDINLWSNANSINTSWSQT